VLRAPCTPRCARIRYTLNSGAYILKPQTTSQNAPATRIFLPIFGTLLALILLVTWLALSSEENRIKKRLAEEESRQLKVYEEALSRDFEAIEHGIRVLSRSSALLRYLEQPGEDTAAILATEFLSHLEVAGIYDQVRFIGRDGRERVRVNKSADGAQIVPVDELQDKSIRYYFADIVDLPSGAIYVSVFDLNMENGEIELPYKPMIRAGMPIDTDDGLVRQGVLLVNILGEHLLAKLSRIAESKTGTVMLLNDEGYWLFSDNPDDQWGFMFPDKTEVTFMQRYPKVWNQITQHNEIIWSDASGIFAARKVEPLHDELPARTDRTPEPYRINPKWYLVGHIEPELLAAIRYETVRRFLFILAVAVTASFLVSIVLAKTIDRNRKYRLELEAAALFDPLTKLPNRILFSDRFEMVRAASIRTGAMVTLLFVDLDHFKQVNDIHGHDAGDELLIQVAQRMGNTLRSTDTVARMGGDEFVVLLAECLSESHVKRGAEKLLYALHQPFQLQSVMVTIGASIGGCIATPENGLELENMIKQADAAMYDVKREGRGAVKLCRPDEETDAT
jgi:diguanylate cyclase